MTTLEIPVVTVTVEDGRQSVVLPLDVRLDAEQVFVKKVGNSILLVPKRSASRSGSTRLESNRCNEEDFEPVSDDFMAERLQPPFETREAMFE